ncbi:hypothetical protein NX96_14455 [Staphylococcus aureus]|nr:hypothetical protein NX96_14455 [Staphylococcus aureus]
MQPWSPGCPAAARAHAAPRPRAHPPPAGPGWSARCRCCNEPRAEAARQISGRPHRAGWPCFRPARLRSPAPSRAWGLRAPGPPLPELRRAGWPAAAAGTRQGYAQSAT